MPSDALASDLDSTSYLGDRPLYGAKELVGQLVRSFRADGTYEDIAMNGRSSGPDLRTLAGHDHAICVVAGENKIPGVVGALRGGFLNTLIIDSPTGEALLRRWVDA